MQVKTGGRIYQEAPAQAEPADSVVTADFYTQLPQIRMTGHFNRSSNGAGGHGRSHARRQ
jgi:hypothetical protein